MFPLGTSGGVVGATTGSGDASTSGRTGRKEHNQHGIHAVDM
jgi:hypothetical protein